MDKNRRSVIFIVIGAVAFLAILYFLSSLNETYLWTETYQDDGEQPYDLSLFKNVLKNSSEEFEVLEGLYADTSYREFTNSAMVYIAGYSVPDSSELSLLKRFVANGNTLFISTKSPGKLFRELDDCDLPGDKRLADELTSIRTQLSSDGKSCEIFFDVYNSPVEHTWLYIENLTCYTTLGTLEANGERQANLVKKNLGQGNLIIHTTPLAFTCDYRVAGQRRPD